MGNPGLQQFKDNLAKGLHGMTVSEGVGKGICIECRQPALANCYSDAGRKEFRISGLCEKCFDKTFED